MCFKHQILLASNPLLSSLQAEGNFINFILYATLVIRGFAYGFDYPVSNALELCTKLVIRIFLGHSRNLSF